MNTLTALVVVVVVVLVVCLVAYYIRKQYGAVFRLAEFFSNPIEHVKELL